MSIKMVSAKLNNLYGFEKFEIVFGDQVTHLVGRNGSGKSTVGLKALMACVCGISENGGKGQLIGERFRFIGKAGKSADAAYTFLDTSTSSKFTIRNHITSGTNSITIKSDGDTPVNEDWLRGFLNIALMSAKNFCALSGRDQAIALGIDTSSFDAEIKKYKEEATLLNRDLKGMGEIEPVEKVDAIDVSALKKKEEEVRGSLNAQYKENRAKNEKARTAHTESLSRARLEMDKHQELQTRRSENIIIAGESFQKLLALGYPDTNGWLMDWIDALPKAEPPINIAVSELRLIDEMPDDSELRKIESEKEAANETNIRARDYLNYLSAFAKKESKKKEIADNKAKQEEATKARNTYISSFKFGFAGLSTDESGCLMLNDRPLTDSYFSRGELEMIVAKLHASINPVFRVRFVDDFDLLDEENQEKLLKELTEADFQVITAEVRNTKPDRENVIVLRECKIQTEEEERPKLI
jgi:hypothetical protein